MPCDLHFFLLLYRSASLDNGYLCPFFVGTDEPEWAAECLAKFRTYPGGQPLETCVDSSQIFKANKQVHFRRLREEFPTVAFEEMLFFDNEIANVRAVSQLGVRCVHCPRGLTAAAWEEGLRLFQQ